MASIQSTIIEFWIRRLKIFGGENNDPQSFRIQMEKMAGELKSHVFGQQQEEES